MKVVDEQKKGELEVIETQLFDAYNLAKSLEDTIGEEKRRTKELRKTNEEKKR